jgi:hypothetical protein
MTKFKVVLVICLMFFAAARISWGSSLDQPSSPHPVTPTGFGFSLSVWMNPNFSGITTAGGGGTSISLNHNLGLGGQSLLIPKIWYRFPHGQILDFSFTQIQQTAAQDLNAPETFQGLFFPQGKPESSNMDLFWGDLSYEYPIYYDTYPPVQQYLNVVLDMKYLQGNFTMTNDLGETTAHPPIYVVFPQLGLHGKFRIARRTTAEFKTVGIMAGFEDAVGYSYDLEGGFTYRFSNQVGLRAEYRNFDFYNRDAFGNTFAFRLYGPQLTLGVDF